MIRRAAVGAVVLGAGLASTTGVAMAHDGGHGHGHDRGSHGHSSSCLNAVAQHNATEGDSFVNVLGGAQTAVPVNVCDIANDNHVLNHITVAVLSGIIPT